MIFVNYKTYEQGTGQKALTLTKLLQEVAFETQVKIIPAVQAADIKEVVASTKLEVWAQKVDAAAFGAHTGATLPEAVFEDGAAGTFLNHSEAKFANFDALTKVFDKAVQVGLKTLIFADDIIQLTKVVSLNPSFVAYEPAELIGSKEKSVAQAHPDIISQASEICKKAGVPLIVGAGVHGREDVKKSLELGAVGVAVATNIVLAADPKAAARQLTEGFR